MLSKYVVVFNEILTSGHVPDSWAIVKIVPIFKNKGNNTDPSNYRGITLLSVIDHIFLLKNLADLYINNKKNLYCAFIDYSKAFDTVWRKGLWLKQNNYKR